MIQVKFARIHNDETIGLPTFAHSTDACADIRSAVDLIIPPKEWRAVPTGLKVEIPHGYEIQVRPRSGLALKYGITVLNSPGTIDSDYRGEIKVLLINHSDKAFEIKKGDRIAQIAIRKVEDVQFVLVEELSETERNEGGFGSSGIS